jgi:uncharacterized protein YbjT (DUF2867 family)
MRIAIAGATGTVGRPTAELLEQRGQEVRRLSRHSSSYPIDLATGAGLQDALAGVEVVVNASNAPPTGGGARQVLVDGTRRLLEAAPEAHHVCVSIVGIEDVPSGYYRVKLAQEAAVRESGRPFTIVRATQFHDLLGHPLRRLARWRIELHSRARFQPVDAGEVAAVLAEVAEGSPRGGVLTVAGPEILTLSEMRAGRGIPVPLPLPPALGRALRAGGLTIADPDVRGTLTYAQWLERSE